jgi:hypothetical protein
MGMENAWSAGLVSIIIAKARKGENAKQAAVEEMGLIGGSGNK